MLAAAAVTNCWVGTFTVHKVANPLPGGFLYDWRHVTDWCGNSTVVTAVNQNYGVNLNTGFLVQYHGSTASSGPKGNIVLMRSRKAHT